MASPAAGTPPFLTKTYAMVEDSATDDTISWNDTGTAFVVWRPAEFARDLLPKHFKHSKLLLVSSASSTPTDSRR
uniref:HSF-type DNA-binding domain-containing protein n=1 Tax=Zea mays TaxID=4577 RepID=B6U0U7_MAIZE|nr:hypothetical protein [Zea mays]